ncbi:MAG: hypothetical protein AB1894_19080 [Chloroflexota bacterium]
MEEEQSYEEPRSGNRLIKWLFVIWFVIAFRNELGLLFSLALVFLKSLIGFPVGNIPDTEYVLRVFGYMGGYLFFLMLLVLVIIVLLSQVILPVYSGPGRRKVAERLFGFLTGMKMPVIFVRLGKLTKELSDPGRVRGGMAIVDLNSAIVLEKQLTPFLTNIQGKPGDDQADSKAKAASRSVARVAGPGVNFIEWNERLRGVVSLQKQFRINLGVKGYTSDGIEVGTHVFSIFTLGQPATVMKVAYDEDGDNICLVKVDESTKRIEAILDELDSQDKAEINSFAQWFLASREPNAQLSPTEDNKDYPPFALEDERIIAAVYSKALNVSDSVPVLWDDLPALIATEVFRNLISQVPYDLLYRPDSAESFPLVQELKPRLGRTVRYMGVMSYQFLQRLDGMPVKVGQKVEHRQFRIAPVQSLRTSKVLRDRGIKVLVAGFSNPKPTDPGVMQQRLENWRARWQREIEIARAQQDREVMGIFNRARLQERSRMVEQLSEILQGPSNEVSLMSIFQILEDCTIDPQVRRVLPQEFITLLRSLRAWLVSLQ